MDIYIYIYKVLNLYFHIVNTIYKILFGKNQQYLLLTLLFFYLPNCLSVKGKNAHFSVTLCQQSNFVNEVSF